MKAKQLRLLAHLPIVWLVPAIALGVALWLIYPEYIDRGTQITIEFANAPGIQVGNTDLEYRGVPAGKVKEVKLKKDLQGVLVRVRLEEQAKSLARKGAQFWIERPQVDLSGVSGLETLLTGARINVIPGTGPLEKYFVGLANPPSLNGTGLGRAFFVFSEHMGTLEPRASVLYKGFKVGEVETSQLTGDARGILTRLRIYNPYVNLVRTNTRFWDAGGLSVHLSLFGGSIKTTSLESIIAGAVAFATPEEPAEPAAEGAQFILYAKAEEKWEKWSPPIEIQSLETTPAKSKRVEEEIEKPLKELNNDHRGTQGR